MLGKWFQFMNDGRQALFNDIALLILRLFFGLVMAFAHGWGKVVKFFAGGEIKFADPIGIGMAPSLFLAGVTEFFVAIALALGLATRLSAIPLAFTMFVAAFIVHADDPFKKQEFAMLYLIVYLALIFTGPGRFSVDAMIKKKFQASATEA